MVTFSYFLGIDQTGAAISNGKAAKPLKVCLIKKNVTTWQVFTHLNSKPLTIESLNLASINNLLLQFDISWPASQLAIIADCVLGIPENLVLNNNLKMQNSFSIWDLLNQARNFEYHNAKFGNSRGRARSF